MSFIGIDLGTSSVKVAVADAHTLTLQGSGAYEYPVLHPQPTHAEQNPEHWWQAVVHATRTALAQAGTPPIVGIGVSGHMHGMVCLDAQHQPVCPAIIWADARSVPQVAALRAFQAQSSTVFPGLPAAGFAAATALWLREHAPSVLAQTAVWVLPKDYVRLRLTGEIATDPSDASATWLYDIARGTWADDILRYCGLTPAQMPPIRASHALGGALTVQAADALGLTAGVPVVVGSADLPANALGHGVGATGSVFVAVGTGGQVFVPQDTPTPDAEQRYYVFNHSLAGRWYAQAAILSGGLSLRWLRDVLRLPADEHAYPQLSAWAAEAPIGAEGLRFLPYLAGERSPHMDAQASGLFFGLRLHHGTAHLARAVMEGVGFALQDSLALIAPQPTPILLSGGVMKSAVWCQILADIWNRELHLSDPDLPYGCLGGMILAGLGVGAFSTLEDATRLLAPVSQVIRPQQPAQYQGAYAQYRRLYVLLKDEMHRATSIVE